MKESMLSLSFSQLEALCKEQDQPVYRAGQLFSWLHKKKVQQFDEMKNLPESFREQLDTKFFIDNLQIVLLQKSQDGTKKYLLRLHDGHCVEAVLMEYSYGHSLCISSQVGCRMGCRFCASTQEGLVRDLTAGEMLGQIYAVQKESQKTVSRVVMMGIGEPLDNYDSTVDFLHLVCDERGQNLAKRNISVSTCGLVPKIEQLAQENLAVTLSISLHAASDEKRRKLMPVAHRYSIAQLLCACKAYQSKTGRRISYEYAVVPDENDTRQDADKLCMLLKKMGGHVNLIPVNATPGLTPVKNSREAAVRFKKILQEKGLNATVRRSLGEDIQAACGQLRAEYAQKELSTKGKS